MQQRPTYGHSPPLHHPVPQHVSTVPQLRSPPPPTSSQPQAYGNPYQHQQHQQQQHPAAGANNNMFGQYGQFMNDPTAQVAAQLSQTAFKQGQEYVEQNVGCSGRWLSGPAREKHTRERERLTTGNTRS